VDITLASEDVAAGVAVHVSVRLSSRELNRLFLSGDTLVQLPLDGAVLEADTAPIAERGHMCALEAGRLAERAGVGRLVLTHISDELDHGFALEQARSSFAGPVEIAAEGSAYEV